MSHTVLIKNYPPQPFDTVQIMRFAGCGDDPKMRELIDGCIKEADGKFSYRVCYCETEVDVLESTCDFGAFSLKSHNLAKNLEGCKNAVLFAATVGTQIDRLIAKYSRLSPSKALVFQAIGAQQIEALCDSFCKDISDMYGMKTKPRYSAGYGDLPLLAQVPIFSLLDCPKNIGLTLNDSLVMSPSKSVTAIVGLCDLN